MSAPTYDKRFTIKREPGNLYRLVRWRGHAVEFVQLQQPDGRWKVVASFAGTPSIGNAARALGWASDQAVPA